MTRILPIFFLLLFPSLAFGDLYKYQGKNGEMVISSEKRSDLKLIEVISSGPSHSKQTVSSGSSANEKKVFNVAAAQKIVETSSARRENVVLPVSQRFGAFDDIIHEASEAYNVPFGFIKAVIRVESNFNPNALSHAGAMGLMQLMPRTAASVNVTDPFDARQNIFGGTRFLRLLIDRYNGDINLILAAYNAGDAAVARYSGIPYPQTRGYVASVYKWYLQFGAEESRD